MVLDLLLFFPAVLGITALLHRGSGGPGHPTAAAAPLPWSAHRCRSPYAPLPLSTHLPLQACVQ